MSMSVRQMKKRGKGGNTPSQPMGNVAYPERGAGPSHGNVSSPGRRMPDLTETKRRSMGNIDEPDQLDMSALGFTKRGMGNVYPPGRR